MYVNAASVPLELRETDHCKIIKLLESDLATLTGPVNAKSSNFF